MGILLILAALAQDDLTPGLVGEYYYTGERMQDFPSLEPGTKPRFKRVDKRIDFDRTLAAFHGTKLKDDFYIRWTGLVRVAKTGKWKFITVSDDGSRLRIDGRVVVENGGTHEMREASGEVELEAGVHEIAIEYFERYGPAGIRLLWEGPGQNKDIIAPQALLHRPAAEPTEEEKKGIELAVEEPRREEKKEPGKVAEKPREEPRREPEKTGGPYDEKIVGKDEQAPDFSGRVASVFQDGPTTLVSVRRGGEERPIFIARDTKVVYLDFTKPEERPTAGYGAYVWLKAGSPDAAAVVKFTK
jgi:hypothetical protein